MLRLLVRRPTRPAVVLIFTQKADDNVAGLIKAVDDVQKNNVKLGTVVIGVSGVQAADLEKLQSTYKLTTPLTVAVDADGPAAYQLNKDAAVTVLVLTARVARSTATSHSVTPRPQPPRPVKSPSPLRRPRVIRNSEITGLTYQKIGPGEIPAPLVDGSVDTWRQVWLRWLARVGPCTSASTSTKHSKRPAFC